jgi:ribosomal protein L7Ae-like RNA K-turn-binding protein
LKPAKLTFAFKHAVIVPEFETLCKDITTLHYTRLKTCLQLACKAGAVVSGHTALQKAMGQGQVVGVMLATDISASQAQAYCDWCERHNIFCCWFFSQQELGQFLGKPSRSAIGLTELRFAERLCMLMTSVEQWQVSHSVSEGRTAFLHTTS